ncbi:MAG: hypothetical protein NWQ72_01020 [Ilumatobacteraceae bacterium]|nr:hypothetical protein [Ilumatobacteraceae bacterium]MDP5068871.1 hypothetical protein [Ilumatobacteraceae bacterium]
MAPFPVYSRRRFLALSASLGLGGLVAACGGSSSSSGAIDGISGTLQVVKRFPTTGLVPGSIRLPISLADTSGVLTTDGKVKLPQTLTGKVIDAASGDVVVASVSADKHDVNMPTPYWPFIVDVQKVGVYLLILDAAPESEMSFQVEERVNVLSPLVGDALPPFDTPTVDNKRGVDPICTSPQGTCPFHEVTLTEALQSGKPVIYLIGTPAYCKTGTCAPGLDALIALSKKVGDAAVFVHADVYTDKTATTAAPAVLAYKLAYEPLLYITDAKGVLVNRLDAVFDVTEMSSALAAVGIS